MPTLMEGHHNFEASMMGMPKGESKAEKQEQGEEQPDFTGEIGHRAELVQSSIDSLTHDMGEADKMLADIKDPTAKVKFAEALKRLREKVNGFGDPQAIAEKMLKEHGDGHFDKAETPPGEMN